MQTTDQPASVPHGPSIFGGLALLIGLGMSLIIVAGMAGGLVHNVKAEIAVLIFAAIPVCAIATALALISLIWRNENKTVGQAALWLNGMIAFFGFPLMVYWLLAM